MPSELAAAVMVSLLTIGLLLPGEAQELPPLEETAPLQLALNAPTAVIVNPEQGEYPAIADRLATGLERLTGSRPSIVPDTADPADLGPGPVIVLGNLMDSRMARRLYLHCYDFTDYSWPSPGGHVVRTIRDPLGTGAHVLMVGGSDPAGAADATEALLAHVEEQGAELGYLNLVKLGRWESEITGYSERFLGDDESVWTRVGGAGSWNYQVQIAQAGIGFLRTGDERYLPVFARELRYWFDHYVLNLRTDAPPQTHGFLNTILTVWDLIRDHPAFDETRHKFDEDWLYVYRSSEGPDKIAREAERTTIRSNHGTRTGLDGLYGGRFFLRRFGLEEARRWLDIADRYFAPQLTSAKPTEDNWGHQWAASLYDTLVYALATDRDEYFSSDALRQAADRALIAHGRGGGPRSYLSACAVATGDTGFLSGYREGEAYGRYCAAMGGSCDEYLRAFCTDDPIEPREDLLGVSVAPLDQLWYETIDATGWNRGGLFVVTAECEQCFDKLSLREGWGADDFYLLFDGISGGQHAYQNANCVVILQEDGATWSSRTGRSLSGSGTVIAGNGVAVALDGAGPGQLHRYARLRYAGQADDYLAVGAALEGVGDADWDRHIIRKRGQWTLVIDRVAVRRAGEVLAERHWYLRGDLAPVPEGLTSAQFVGGRQHYLHLQTAGVLPEGMSGGTDRAEAVRALATPDEPLEFATLLHVTRDADAPEGWLWLRALDAACTGDPPAPDGIGLLDSLDIVVLRATERGGWLEMPFRLDQDLAGEVFVKLLGFTDRGDVRVLLDGQEEVARYEHRAPSVVGQRLPLGRRELAAGDHVLRLEVVGEPEDDGQCYIGLGGLLIRPDGAPAADPTSPDQPIFSVTRTGDGWRVDGPEAAEFVLVGDEGMAVLTGSGVAAIGKAPDSAPASHAAALAAAARDIENLLPLRPDCPVVASPWRELTVGDSPVVAVARGADGRVAAADAAGNVVLFDATGAQLGSARFESEVLALHFVGEDLMVGEDRGAFTRLAADGSQRRQIVIPYVPMPWDYWTEYRSRVREITSADITGDGEPEILVANSDRRVYAFAGDGEELWKTPVEWGVFTAMTAGRFRDAFALFGGTSRPSIHGRCIVFGAEGQHVAYLSRPDLVSWSIPSQFKDMRLTDLDGDGVPEVINAVDTNCRQLVVYREDGSVLWDADLAGAAQALAVAPAGAEGEGAVVYCGSASGYVAAFEGAGGERRWSCYLGEPTALLAFTDDGGLAAATPSGTIFLLSADGRLQGRVELGGNASAFVRPGDQRAGDRLLLGTEDGRVVTDS